MTNDLEQRVVEHYINRENPKTFAGRYNCFFLIYYERFDRPIHAIEREKEIKSMSRKQKEALIAEENPKWDFWNEKIMEWPPDASAVMRGC